MQDSNETILRVENLKVEFRTDEGIVNAVDGVTFAIRRGEILGLVGESGSGKSVSSLAIMGLLPAGVARVKEGRILFDGQDLLRLREADMRRLRGRRIGMIFQEPLTALNPVFTVGHQLVTGILAHENISRRAARERAIELLALVGMADPAVVIDAYPFQMSGGMRQRVLIAMALSSGPDLLIADEPTTALDVTIQAQILDLLREIRKKTGIAILFITHDLAVISELCDAVAVLYAGEVQECGSVHQVFSSPRHPYTRGLLSCIADPASGKPLVPIEGRPPLLSEVSGCRFAPRCPHALAGCHKEHPTIQRSENEREIRCLRWQEIPSAS